ncbi:ligand-dependent corepressor isoform X2 [Hippoglossus hippoglossus]|uniref:ligand-dependent corepressor isoform X2 n=2 Tax=Hippoglossus TaxID=8266 RepID=UPI00148D8532|nr:ligand-dependent corepressor isoform X2 [Hippoglossus hippoglossus]
MASLCKRQQCTVERRGFRQELDSWRHKLIHCVGFESILDGLFGPGLVKDITLFQDCEPEEVSDWSFDENCLFCCLRREKIKDHAAEDGGGSQSLSEDFKREQSRISRLERQAQDFLNAVFHRKDLPSFSDPHIPLVAREIMQRMIRQFAAEYTSKTTQDDLPLPNGTMKDQSLPIAASLALGSCSPPGPLPAPSSPPSPASSSPSPTPGPGLSPASASAAAAAAAASAATCTQSSNGTGASNGGGGGGGTAAASAQNPVLSKLLMADQDGPLDLTVKKNQVDSEPSQQDGVLDLSTKKNNGADGHKTSSGFPPASGVKGRSLKVEHPLPEVDEDDGLLQKSLQDGVRENSSSFKPPLARSLRIKEELLSQKHRLLSQPAALSLANLEAAGLLSHGQSHSLLGQKGSSSFWGSKAHLESLMKLKQASGALSGALSDLKDLPTFLENHHHNHHGAFSIKSSLLHHHHNQVSKAQHHHQNEGKRDQGHSPPVDLKIPQVRGMDLSWDSHASDLYGYSSMGGGGLGDNTLSRKLRAILPKQNRRGSSLGSLLDGAADYWSSDLEHSISGPAYSTSDVEGDPNSKQPRKKRGRYRQYNSEILEEAITVVMNGKMSVSKAQNMYGIPHSTLEYKVKERLGTLKNPPKKKLKLMMKMEAGGQDFPAESENTPTSTPRDDGPPLAAAELKDNVKEEIDDNFKPID